MCACSVEGRFYFNNRSWQPRKQQEEAAWVALLLVLTDRYLQWRYGDTSVTSSSPLPNAECAASESLPSSSTGAPTTPDAAADSLIAREDTSAEAQPGETAAQPSSSEDASTPSAALVWEFDVLDIFTLETRRQITRQTDSISPALDMMRHGFVAKTSKKPQVAISVRTLELLHRLRNRKPSFSIEAFAKIICDYYMVSQFSRHSVLYSESRY